MNTLSTLPAIEYKKILYVTDLSESGRYAFPYAARIAQLHQSQLTVFHVVDPSDLEVLLGFTGDRVWGELANRSVDEARQILISRKRNDVAIRTSIQQHCEDSLATDPDKPIVTYEIKVELGEPLDKILEEAHGGAYDLLVIAKRGKHASVKDAVMGDTARRIIRRSRIPVMVVPLPE